MANYIGHTTISKNMNPMICEALWTYTEHEISICLGDIDVHSLPCAEYKRIQDICKEQMHYSDLQEV